MKHARPCGVERQPPLRGFVERRLDEGGDIGITFSGLRSGEKLYEELLIGDNAQPTDHPRIMKANEVAMRHEALSELLALLRQACARHDVAWLRSLLEAAPIGYSPSHRIADLMWIKQVRQGLKIVVPASGAA